MIFTRNQINSLQLSNKVLVGLESLAPLILKRNPKSLILVTSPGFVRRGILANLLEGLKKINVHVISNVSANPRIEDIESQFNEAKNLRPDMFVALGGGSVIDTAKALSRRFSIPSQISLMDYLENPESFELLVSVPIIAIPTTSGTGSEVTPFASVWSDALSKKFSVTGSDLIPSTVILDSRLTHTLSREVTLSSGLDTVSHALESLWNKNQTHESKQFAVRSLEISLNALPKLANELDDTDSRERMMISSFFGGLAIARTRTALAHSISYPLTANFGVPHGVACSFTLPQILEFNSEIAPNYFVGLAESFGFEGIAEFSSALQKLLILCNVREELFRNIEGEHALIGLIDQMQDSTRAGNNLREANDCDIKRILVNAVAKLDPS